MEEWRESRRQTQEEGGPRLSLDHVACSSQGRNGPLLRALQGEGILRETQPCSSLVKSSKHRNAFLNSLLILLSQELSCSQNHKAWFS